MPDSLTAVADRVWVARHAWFDVNVTVIGGEAGLVVVDTHASLDAVRDTLARVREVSSAPVVAVVNTHSHFDHVLGNAVFEDVPVLAHEETAAALAAFRDDRPTYDGERAAEVDASPVVLPTDTFSSARVVDLGDRQVELLHPGRGHTAGDVVVRVPDADVLLTGDLVEESAPPAYGEDCWPMEWPTSLDLAISLMTDRTVVVPGHGAVVDLDFVHQQRGEIGIVAETIRDLAGRGVPASQALAQGEWPWPQELLEHAVARGYEQLPRASKRLPLI
ncbi:MBL fold metallo-hydrolase [Nocardioides sp. JQ2195]|uniref:MBL fold metallo-hydrolase n=1 Tax=Nocardioides sp. JQ2195 TaxID=2592334 RepID=UPI00143E992A|nr:MBL fold metallo-hydrolase [Nocardioides sp. JQ2195]QIX27360.1 MBL fold metallo-hydrolase [Nocardioides sp. JQ2195]